MNPILYKIPTMETNIEELKIGFNDEPDPKLIKYGFNVNDKIDYATLTHDLSYKIALEYDIGRSMDLLKTHFGIKDIDESFLELWEIFVLFKFFEPNKKQVVLTSNHDVSSKIIQIYKNLSRQNISVDLINKGAATLIVQRYSDVDIEENAFVQILMNDLPNFLLSQELGANMILQLFNVQTQIMVEIIGLLNSIYDKSYLIKPTVSSNISDSKYIVLTNLKIKMKINVPKNPNNSYITSLGFIVSSDLSIMIQCFNSEILSKKHKTFNIIKYFLGTGVYENSLYQELLQKQDKNITNWLSVYGSTESFSNDKLDFIVNETEKKCNYKTNIRDIYK